jgi:hypothetical protein
MSTPQHAKVPTFPSRAPVQMAYVPRDTCNYSLDNWPAAEHACAPWYNLNARGGSQRLPVFELPQDPHLQPAEGVAYQGFQKLEAEGPR